MIIFAFKGLVLRSNNTVNVICRLSSFTGEGTTDYKKCPSVIYFEVFAIKQLPVKTNYLLLSH